MAGGTLFSLDKAAPEDKGILWYLRERGEVADLDRRVRLRARRHREEAAHLSRSLYEMHTDSQPQPVRANPAGYSAFTYSDAQNPLNTATS